MNNRIVTISREFGSGGRTIGRLAAEKLGIPCYDQELIERLSKKSGFTEDYIKEQGENGYHGGWLPNINGLFSGQNLKNMHDQDYLWAIQEQIICELAEKEPCVIVGRCADYILRFEAGCLKVFIHASFEKRAERIVQVYGETDVPIRKRLEEKDKRRAAYYQTYTDAQWGQVRNYHMALDSGVLGIDTCAELIAELYKKRPC